MKTTLLQYFQWYTSDDGKTWVRLKEDAERLSDLGYTGIWMPPAYKCLNGTNDVGYGVYDLYDLGEFDQKGTVRTKYGTRDEFQQAIDALHEKRVMCLADIVLNHRMGADGTDQVKAVKVDPNNRDQAISDLMDIEAWTRFDFPGRNGQYSDFKWDWNCFKGTDYDAKSSQNGIFLFEGKQWDENVSGERGNFDYIMGADLDFDSQTVTGELYNWGRWFQQNTGIDGFRLDAVKSIDSKFYHDWLKMMFDEGGTALPVSVGEYWSGNVDDLLGYINDSDHCMRLFDVPLHFNLKEASSSNGQYDIRNVFSNTLTEREPRYAVSFVDNHDTQPTQALESWVEDWFKTSAYALVLLNRSQMPCVFQGDVEGIEKTGNPPVEHLEEMVWIRNHILGDDIAECNDEDSQKNCWMVQGNHPVGVILTIGDQKDKDVSFPQYAGKTFVNLMNRDDRQTLNENGDLHMHCDGGKCSVYLLEEDIQKLDEAMNGLKPASSGTEEQQKPEEAETGNQDGNAEENQDRTDSKPQNASADQQEAAAKENEKKPESDTAAPREQNESAEPKKLDDQNTDQTEQDQLQVIQEQLKEIQNQLQEIREQPEETEKTEPENIPAESKEPSGPDANPNGK